MLGHLAAFIDYGNDLAVPAMLGALTPAGCTPEQLDWLMLTHVHLHHAGGAGLLEPIELPVLIRPTDVVHLAMGNLCSSRPART